MMAIEGYEGKQIYVILKTNRRYSGKCIEVIYIGDNDKNFPNYLITMIDKFGKYISFSNNEISVIEEEELKNE